ncbi:MAG TPA: NF038122 family metalloprotease [Rubricoccaceae bacterium]
MIRLRLLPGLLALALPFAAPSAHAQQLAARDIPVAHPEDHAPGGVHILTVLPDGSLGCDVATEAQAEALRSSDEAVGTVRLTPLPSLNRGGTGFRILIRATDQLLERPAALLAFRRAAARWESIIQSNVTTVMDLDYGPNRFGTPYGTGILGSTNSAQTFVGTGIGSQQIRDAIAARQVDAALLALVNAIPVPTPSTISGEAGTTPLGQAIGGLVPLQALGFRPAVTSTSAGFGTVANIGFNSAFAYDFNPRDGISAGQTDFEAVAVHEIGHALGFTSAIGGATVGNPYFTPWDLYRVRPEAVTPGEPYTDGAGWEVTRRIITPGPTIDGSLPGNQVMFVGDTEYELSTATGSRTGGDSQQASHWRADEYRSGPDRYIGIMDPTLAAGDREEITAADIRALELFGFSVDRTPSTAAATLTLAGTPVNIDFLTPVVRQALPLAGGALTFQIGNTGGPDALTFDAEVVVDRVQTLTPGSTPTLTLSAASGSVAPGTQTPLTVSVSGSAGGAVVYGRLQLRLNDVNRGFADVPFQISIGSPGVAPAGAAAAVSVPSNETLAVTLDIRNPGDAPLSYVRILEPAASDPGTAFHPIEGQDVSAPGPVADETESAPLPDDAAQASLAQLNITGPATLRLYDLTQLPTGEILAVDGGAAATTTIYRAPADLAAVTATYTSASTFGGQVTGLAYNEKTGSLWIAIQETGLLREVRLDGTTIVATGPEIQTGVAPFGLDYSSELDAFVYGVFGSNAVYMVDAAGTVLPGYPIAADGRTNINPTTTPGVAFTEGLLEMTSFSTRIFQSGQFGKTVVGSTDFILPVAAYGLQRSATDPNGTLYFTSRTGGSVASIRTIDPTDLPANVGTRLDAREPLYSQTLLAPGMTRSLALFADARGLPQGTATDELAFLTNSPAARIVRFPVTINVGAVADEAGPDAAIDAVSTWPNPARGAAQVRLSVSTATTATVEVYNTLGQRIAVLADAATLAPGMHAFDLDAGSLAAGVYVVRVQAGDAVTTQKLTVVR